MISSQIFSYGYLCIGILFRNICIFFNVAIFCRDEVRNPEYFIYLLVFKKNSFYRFTVAATAIKNIDKPMYNVNQ